MESMNRLTNALAGVALSGTLAAAGCQHTGKCYDPCWPQRYSAASRQEVISAFAPQVQNGHILDQTLYNTQFEAGTDQLTASGRDQLDILMRRRPAPDPRIFLATARDVSYDPNNPDALVTTRSDLDNRRAAAVQRYLAAQTAGRPMTFEVVVHDPMSVGEAGDPANRSIRLNYNSTAGSLSGGATATTASSTGSSGTGGQGGQGQAGGTGANPGSGPQPTQTPR
jgi:hypothetical protein